MSRHSQGKLEFDFFIWSINTKDIKHYGYKSSWRLDLESGKNRQ